MFKRVISAFLACCTAVGVLTACGSPASQTEAQGTAASSLNADGKVQIVTTIFPLYDWTRQILGEEDQADLQFLLGDGVDFHNYQATAKDIMTVSEADLLVYVGGTSDHWIEEACAQNPNPDRVEINLMELLADRLKTEELVEGMEHSHEDEDEHEHTPEEEAILHDEHDHDGTAAYDEHVWLSVKNAEIVCDALTKALAELLPESAQQLNENAKAYQAELTALDEQFQQAADSASNKTLMFADRFPFRYLTDDYGLSYYAAFTGCSTDTQASFETISFLAQKVGDLSLGTILTIDDSDGKIAQTVAQNTGGAAPEILTMNSMQSITRAQADEGVTYLSVMQENLSVLRTALGCT